MVRTLLFPAYFSLFRTNTNAGEGKDFHFYRILERATFYFERIRTWKECISIFSTSSEGTLLFERTSLYFERIRTQKKKYFYFELVRDRDYSFMSVFLFVSNEYEDGDGFVRVAFNLRAIRRLFSKVSKHGNLIFFSSLFHAGKFYIF